MEASGAFATDDPTLAKPGQPKPRLAKLLRDQLFWASAAAFVGVVVGLAATFSMAAWHADSSNVSTGLPALALWGGSPAYVLAALSLLGVPILLSSRGSRALQVGTALLLVWLPVQIAAPFPPLLSPLAMVRR